MAYSSYQELQSEIQSYLNRTDPDVVNRIPNWVKQAEDALDRVLRHPASVVVTPYNLKAGEDTLRIPKGLVQIKSMVLKATGNHQHDTVLYRRTVENMLTDSDMLTTGPTGFITRASQYELNRPMTHDGVIELEYYTAPNRLVNSADSSLYLVQCSDILLYKALSEGFSYLLDPGMSDFYGQRAAQAYDMLQNIINEEEMSGSTLVYVPTNANLYF